MAERYFKHRYDISRNWKINDEIICVQSAGKIFELTIGKTYKNIEIYSDYGADEVRIQNDAGYISNAFCSRFTRIKEQRKEKLQKIKNSI